MKRKVAAVLLTGVLLTGTMVTAVFAESAAGSDSALTSKSVVFTDVVEGPDSSAIHYVVERGLFSGTEAGRFGPSDLFTRGMAVTVLGKLAQTAGSAEEASGETGGVFSDVAQTAYYASAVDFAVKNHILQGVSSDRFAPDQPISRGELTGLAANYLKWLGRSDGPIMPEGGDQPVTRSEAAVVFEKLERFLSAKETTVLTHKAEDGVTLKGKLDLPAEGAVERIVLFINGSGPNTYDNRRKSGDMEFNYYDLFAEQLTARGIGFFRWNTRGVSEGSKPPTFADIDTEVYKTYVPETSISDIHEWIQALKENPRLANAEVYLLGWSEGSIIAPNAAKRYPGEIDGLLLAGYCNDSMAEILDWQQTGGSSMVFYKGYFDYDGDGTISKEELEEDRYGVRAQLGIEFADVDVNKDGIIDRADFEMMLKPGKEALYDAIERKDDDWVAENYGMRLTSAWFDGHKALTPNRELMPTLSLPIEIFHGTMDQNCSVEGAYAIEKTFREKGKTNLKLNVYGGYDHDMNYAVYLMTGRMPQAFTDLFQRCAEI